MKFDKNLLTQMGFGWQGNTKIDGTELGDAPDNIVNGAMIGSRDLSPEEMDLLIQGGVDTSMAQNEFKPFNPVMQPVEPVESVEGIPAEETALVMEEGKGAQSDEENMEMLLKLRSASRSYQDTKNVIQEQLNKLTDIMSNTVLTEEQQKLKGDFLKFMSSAHRYSFNNMILTFMQRSDAEMTGGQKNFWNKKGRELKAGEEPIYVLAPVVTGQPNLSREQYFGMLNNFMAEGKSKEEAKKAITRYRESKGILVGFKDVPVYDVKQTNPIPGWKEKTGEEPFDFEGFHKSYRNQMNDPTEYSDALWNATTAAMEYAGIDVDQGATGVSGGYSAGGTVRINEESMGEARVATLFHEYAHEVLHTNEEGRKKRIEEKTPKHIIEAEAESTAWLLMQAFDMQGDPEWAARYMTLWKATPKEVMERQENIHKAYSKIYRAVTGQLDKMIGNNNTSQQPMSPQSMSSSWYGHFKNGVTATLTAC